MNFIDHIKKQHSLNIISEEKKDLKIKALMELIKKNKKTLLDLNVQSNDVIAIVIDNGVQFVSSFFSIINSCVIAPLNPSYSETEYEFYYSDLKPKALVTDKGKEHPALIIAKKKKIKILDVKENIFINYNRTAIKKKVKYKKPCLNDTAIILHTSGTTSKPKMVALSHANLLNSCKNISNTLKLKKIDKNIILMPSFHIHGIVASILAPLYVGSKIVTLSKFNALSFYKFLDFHKPTWFTAVPTMLQGILDRAKNNNYIIKNSKLRFIRSSSASLPVNILKKLEQTFKVPVIESYGMTEASHQMTSNLLPPFKRKPGSVGISKEVKVKIIDSSFKSLKNGKIGEVVIKGKNVLKGYIANKSINDKAFINGWFRTGDLGYFDRDNYLYITGRIKEIINRGGEKISPKEVDDVFILHPKIAKVITFSLKHEKLGEDIAAAVVLKENLKCTTSELKNFVKNKLAPFKIPRKIFFLKNIPVGATGKIQRIGLAKKIGIE